MSCSGEKERAEAKKSVLFVVAADLSKNLDKESSTTRMMAVRCLPPGLSAALFVNVQKKERLSLVLCSILSVES